MTSMRGTPTRIGLAAVAGHVDGLLDGGAEADDLEGHVGAPAAGERHDRGDGVAVVGLHEVGGAELLGHLELRLEHVDGDDLGRRRRSWRPG